MRRAATAVLAMLLAMTTIAQDAVVREGYFEVRSAETSLTDGVYLLDSRLQLVLSSEALEILERVNELFLQLSEEPEAGVGDLRNRVLELVMHLVGEERKTAIAGRQAAHDREVELLERRIGKLKGNLQASERSLAGLSNSGQVDPGISSIYRDVQGLGAQDSNLDRKRSLMADIFRANVALQKGAVDDN